MNPEPRKGAVAAMLWKTQLLDLVGEAPKAQCIDCTGISPNHRFVFSCPSTISGEDVGSESDFSSHSPGLQDLENGNNGHGQGHVVHVHDFEQDAKDQKSEIQKLTHLIQVNLEMVDSFISEGQDSESREQAQGKHIKKINGNLLEVAPPENIERKRSCQTAAAPWHRPSIYYFNPFGTAFHGNLSPTSVKRLLTEDGQFLVRKRTEDSDDEFVLSMRFNGRIKNFLITFDDTSGLIFMGNRDKGFEHLEEMVQQGLTTLFLEHKAGPYIDLLYDLTRNEYRMGPKYLASLTTKQDESTFTADCIYEFFENRGSENSISRHGKFGHSYKQNSPSPVSSLSGSSLERVRQPDLRAHSFQTHTFQQLSKCHICQNFLWGLSGQGLLCQHCDLIIHEGCLEKVTQECEPDLSRFSTVFGISLTVMVKATPGAKPPFVLQKCISEIDKRGLHVEGIYRISGTRDGSEKLKNVLEKDRELADLSGHNDIHSMCSIVKQFLRKLPEPLISEEVFNTFLNENKKANGSPTVSASSARFPGFTPAPTSITVDSVRRELKKLPPAHYVTLKYLLQHLHRVADRSELNKMNPYNLSSIFAPSVFCPLQTSIETLQVGTVLLELMITQVRNLFPK